MPESSFEAYERDVQARILHSETRIKNWVIGGVLANLLVLIGIGAPMVYYFGQLSTQTATSATVLNQVAADVNRLKDGQAVLRTRQNAIIAHLRKDGFEPPEVELD